MRRLLGVALVTVLLAALLAVPAAASESIVDGDATVLAVAAGVQGPDPQPRLDENNQARELAGYDDRDVPFTWGAAWILTFTGMVGLALLVGLYWLLVHRPSRQGPQAS